MTDTRTPGPLIGPRFIMFGLVLIAVLLGLGVWQLQRLEWKTDLIVRVEAGLSVEPSSAPAPNEWTMLDRYDEYRRIQVSGHYAFARELLVKAVTEQGAGFWVIAPFETDGGWSLFINRGFITNDQARIAYRKPEAGRTALTGLLRLTQAGGAFLRNNSPAENRWFSRDVVAMAEAYQIDEIAPYFLDLEFESEMPPIGGLTNVNFPNSHLGYALTYLIMALIVSVFLFIKRERK